MNIKIIPFLFVFWMNFQAYTTMAQTPKVLRVVANKPTGTVQQTMWGVFFEDINFGADGGIYAELIKNR